MWFYNRIVLLAIILITAPQVEAIDGDIDKDGDVDFSDFLILAQNFGKTGPPPQPEQPDTVYVTKRDTIYVTVIDTIYIDRGAPSIPYDRDLYRHWIDADRDCQDTRQEVLFAESIQPVTLDERGCRVISGVWVDAYTGQTFTDPGALDIDHFIPLAEAHRSGADAWSEEQRRAFANDLSNPDALIAVSRSANRSKGDRDPSDWMPPDESFHCQYVKAWVALKEVYGLSMDAKEMNFLNNHPCLKE